MAPNADKKPVEKKLAPEKPAEEKENKVEAAEKTPGGKKPRAEKFVPPSKDGGAPGDKKRNSKQNDDDYKNCILEVLKQLHPNIEISSKSMSIINDILEKIAQEASRLAGYNNKPTICSADAWQKQRH